MFPRVAWLYGQTFSCVSSTKARASSFGRVGILTSILTAMPNPPSFARPDRRVACDYCALHVLLVLPGHEFDSAAEAGSVPRRKQVLRRRGVGQSRSTHFLRTDRLTLTE
jgi:hypothetical protein